MQEWLNNEAQELKVLIQLNKFDIKTTDLAQKSIWFHFPVEERVKFISESLLSPLPRFRLISLFQIAFLSYPWLNLSHLDSKPSVIFRDLCITIFSSHQYYFDDIFEWLIINQAPLWILQLVIWKGINPFENDECVEPRSNREFWLSNSKLEIGHVVLCRDTSDGAWIAIVLNKTDDKVLIHYYGWGVGYNEWIPYDSDRIKSLVDLSPSFLRSNQIRRFSMGNSVYERAVCAENFDTPFRHYRYSSEISILFKIYQSRMKRYSNVINNLTILLPPLVDIVCSYHELISISEEINLFSDFEVTSKNLSILLALIE